MRSIPNKAEVSIKLPLLYDHIIVILCVVLEQLIINNGPLISANEYAPIIQRGWLCCEKTNVAQRCQIVPVLADFLRIFRHTLHKTQFHNAKEVFTTTRLLW